MHRTADRLKVTSLASKLLMAILLLACYIVSSSNHVRYVQSGSLGKNKFLSGFLIGAVLALQQRQQQNSYPQQSYYQAPASYPSSPQIFIIPVGRHEGY